MKNNAFLYVDVDGTLLKWPGPTPGLRNDGTPEINKDLIKQLRKWKERTNGYIIVWSGNGKTHADWAVDFMGIEDLPDFVLGKPNIFIDDTYEWIDTRPKYNPDIRL